MELTKKQKPNVEDVQAVDVELNEEQLESVSGGVVDDGSGTGCTGGHGIPIWKRPLE